MTKNLIDALYKLAQLDIDAVSAYEQALKHIDDQTIYAKIDQFRLDHVRHIDELTTAIIEHGGTPPERSPDLKGYLIEGFTSLRSITGTKGALNAMETNEMLTNKTYKNALDNNPDMPMDIRALLEKNYGDEQRHLDYIRQALATLKLAS